MNTVNVFVLLGITTLFLSIVTYGTGLVCGGPQTAKKWVKLEWRMIFRGLRWLLCLGCKIVEDFMKSVRRQMIEQIYKWF